MVLLSPFVVAFVYPVVMLIMMYGAAVFLHVYRHRRREIFDAYSENYWDGAMQTVAAVFDAHGSLWHGKKNNFSHGGISCKCFAKLINSRQVSWVRDAHTHMYFAASSSLHFSFFLLFCRFSLNSRFSY